MPRNRKEPARPALRGACRKGQPHPTPAEASLAGRLLKDFERWQSMSEEERRAYDLGWEAGRAEAAPVLLPPERQAQVRIPKLELQSLPRYISAVSKALERGQLTAQDARAMLYAAQMLLAAWNALGEVLPEEPPETRIGFIQAAAEQLAVSIRHIKLH